MVRIAAGLVLSSIGALCAANVAGSSQDEELAPPPNMKGRVYPGIANALDNFPLQHRGKFFDMLAPPITTHYSEVFWTAQPAMDLPAHIVQEFAGRAISFTGFEVDIVEVFPNGTEVPDVPSIPSYEVYNHHYCATVRGEKAKMVYVGKGTAKKNGVKRRAIEVNPAEWEPRAVEGPSANWTVPTAQNFWQGNGGEHRMSFKHFPEGSGQLVERQNSDSFSICVLFVSLTQKVSLFQPRAVHPAADAHQHQEPERPGPRPREEDRGRRAAPEELGAATGRWGEVFGPDGMSLHDPRQEDPLGLPDQDQRLRLRRGPQGRDAQGVL